MTCPAHGIIMSTRLKPATNWPMARTVQEAISDLPVIDALAQFRSGELRRGARRFDIPLPYTTEHKLSAYVEFDADLVWV